MKKLKFTLIFIVTYLLFSGSILFYYSTVTKGQKIKEYEISGKALLVVDLQEDCLGLNVKENDRYNNQSEIVFNTNKFIDYSKENNIDVILIKQEFGGIIGKLFSTFFANGKLIKGTKGTDIYSKINNKDIPIFTKPKGDAFSNKKLSEYLTAKQISELFVIGIDGQFCVLHTALGGINRGYKVSIIKDAIGFKNSGKKEDTFDKYSENNVKILSANQFVN